MMTETIEKQSKSQSIVLPKLSELVSDSDPVIKAFLGRLDSPYGFWYEVVPETGEFDLKATLALYEGFRKELGGDELVGAMPLMRYQPAKGAHEHMLLRKYDHSIHGIYDFKKGEEDWLSRRRSCSTMHPEIRNCGSTLYYGGYESSFDPRSVLVGPLYAGNSCTVRSSAKVIGPTLLGSHTLLNTSSVLTRTILGSRSQIDDLVSTKDSIIGSKVYIMSGAKLMHRDAIDGHTIEVVDRRVGSNTSGKKTEVKRHKMGSVIGDGCVIGANAVLGPGTILMPGVRVPHGMYVPTGIYDQWGISNLTKRH